MSRDGKVRKWLVELRVISCTRHYPTTSWPLLVPTGGRPGGVEPAICTRHLRNVTVMRLILLPRSTPSSTINRHVCIHQQVSISTKYHECAGILMSNPDPAFPSSEPTPSITLISDEVTFMSFSVVIQYSGLECVYPKI